jgi:hypothetical protein
VFIALNLSGKFSFLFTLLTKNSNDWNSILFKY